MNSPRYTELEIEPKEGIQTFLFAQAGIPPGQTLPPMKVPAGWTAALAGQPAVWGTIIAIALDVRRIP